MKPATLQTDFANLPTPCGTFRVCAFVSSADGREHIALTMGKFTGPVLTRVHSQCVTGDALLSLRCDCREQLHKSMERIGEAGSGVLVYLNQEGRGTGLANKIRAYALQDTGDDTVEANQALGLPPDARDYKAAAEILKKLGVRDIRLLTNNPDKERQLSALGIRVVERIPLETEPTETNRNYLETKKRKLKHRLTAV